MATSSSVAEGVACGASFCIILAWIAWAKPWTSSIASLVEHRFERKFEVEQCTRHYTTY